jgi:ATP-dependent RNA helicase DeaD
MEKFTKLGLSKEVTDVLRKAGFKEPTEIQEKTIPLALAGKDIIGGSATGSGKTLAFASPIIENLKPNKKVQALILTPTRELAEQVASSIRDFSQNKKLNVLPIYGGINIEPQIRRLYSADVVVGTPGRILDHLNRGSLRLDGVKFLVLDEVDRMFDMGFSRDVEKIITQCPPKRQTMMFSATISQDIDYLAKKYTNNAVEVAVKSHVDPKKLKQVYYDIQQNRKFSLLVTLLKNENAELVMVFCSTRRNVDYLADNLKRLGLNVKSIHGGIDQKKRMRVMEEFHHQGLGVLICTDVAARGLDIKGVTHVYNYDVPDNPKDYIHRIGRTARAGEQGKAITILASRDYENFGNLNKTKEFIITPERIPQVENLRMELRDSKGRRESNRGNSNRSSSRGPPRRSSDRRDSGRGSHNRSHSRGSSHGSSRHSGSNRGDSRRDFSRDTSRGSSRDSSGRRSNNRRSNYR